MSYQMRQDEYGMQPLVRIKLVLGPEPTPRRSVPVQVTSEYDTRASARGGRSQQFTKSGMVAMEGGGGGMGMDGIEMMDSGYGNVPYGAPGMPYGSVQGGGVGYGGSPAPGSSGGYGTASKKNARSMASKDISGSNRMHQGVPSQGQSHGQPLNSSHGQSHAQGMMSSSRGHLQGVVGSHGQSQHHQVNLHQQGLQQGHLSQQQGHLSQSLHHHGVGASGGPHPSSHPHHPQSGMPYHPMGGANARIPGQQGNGPSQASNAHMQGHHPSSGHSSASGHPSAGAHQHGHPSGHPSGHSSSMASSASHSPSPSASMSGNMPNYHPQSSPSPHMMTGQHQTAPGQHYRQNVNAGSPGPHHGSNVSGGLHHNQQQPGGSAMYMQGAQGGMNHGGGNMGHGGGAMGHGTPHHGVVGGSSSSSPSAHHGGMGNASSPYSGPYGPPGVSGTQQSQVPGTPNGPMRGGAGHHQVGGQGMGLNVQNASGAVSHSSGHGSPSPSVGHHVGTPMAPGGHGSPMTPSSTPYMQRNLRQSSSGESGGPMGPPQTPLHNGTSGYFQGTPGTPGGQGSGGGNVMDVDSLPGMDDTGSALNSDDEDEDGDKSKKNKRGKPKNRNRNKKDDSGDLFGDEDPQTAGYHAAVQIWKTVEAYFADFTEEDFKLVAVSEKDDGLRIPNLGKKLPSSASSHSQSHHHHASSNHLSSPNASHAHSSSTALLQSSSSEMIDMVPKSDSGMFGGINGPSMLTRLMSSLIEETSMPSAAQFVSARPALTEIPLTAMEQDSMFGIVTHQEAEFIEARLKKELMALGLFGDSEVNGADSASKSDGALGMNGTSSSNANGNGASGSSTASSNFKETRSSTAAAKEQAAAAAAAAEKDKDIDDDDEVLAELKKLQAKLRAQLETNNQTKLLLRQQMDAANGARKKSKEERDALAKLDSSYVAQHKAILKKKKKPAKQTATPSNKANNANKNANKAKETASVAQSS